MLPKIYNAFVTVGADNKLSNMLNIALEYVEGEVILMLLDE
jgi:cysteine sulfinate desulfinase/cysteine desulfurase-like protein